MSRHFARLEASRSLRLVVLVLSACVFAFSLYLAWLAFSIPVELEIREGSVWLQALAKRAGIDIYDTRRVAFVNMNHGPIDPIVKGWITTIAPGLPGHMVTRAFVLFCPIFLFAAAYVITRRHLAAAMLAAGALFLIFCHMSWMMFVGRSDATAVCGLAVCGALTHRLLVSRHRNWSNRRYIATQVGLGAASAVVILTSWRYAPVVGALQAVVFTSQVPNSILYRKLADKLAGQARWRATRALLRSVAWLGAAAMNLTISTALYVAGFAVIWVPVFLFELHGDFRSYYRHFFGFFSGESGWGSFTGASFRLLPPELVYSRDGSILLFAALILLGLYRVRRQVGELIAWMLMLSVAYFAVSYGYFKNQGGGGLHYFFEFFAFAWIFILHAFSRRRRWGPLPQLLLVCVVVLALPYRGLLAQPKMLVGVRTEARAFRRDVARLTKGQRVFGEEAHLFKTRYQGELVDTGDTDSAIAASGYFGKAFTRTYDAYARNLVANPPKFVIGGLLGANSMQVMSPPLKELLQRRYTMRLIARGTSIGNGGGSQALFERND